MNKELINKEDSELCTEKGTEVVEHPWDKCPQEKENKMRHPLAFHAEGKNFQNFQNSKVIAQSCSGMVSEKSEDEKTEKDKDP